MASRADGRYPRERSRSRDRSSRYQHHERSRSRDRSITRDGDRRSKGKGRGDDDQPSKSRSRSPVRRRSASPRRLRSPSRSRHINHSRSPSRSRERRKDRSRDRRRRSRSRSRSVSSSSDDSDRERRKHKKKHKRKRSRSRDRDRKERKKEKRDKKKKKSGNVGHQWGKYGIINETDLYSKEAEFRAWLVEERVINPETITKDQTKKEFAKFVEDYNTATLPHEKFYNIVSYETRMSALRQGEFVPPPNDQYDFNADMKELQGAHKKKPREQDSYMTKEQLMELRKVQAERVEAGKMKLLGMDIKQNMGVRMDGSTFDEF